MVKNSTGTKLVKCDMKKSSLGEKKFLYLQARAAYSENDIAEFMCISPIQISSYYI